ncbi:hypothetical protein GE061_005565 [Apolygus lucorum]|uniref:FP protein C-terminal domain-containing protein n=1 Tax=Apolygus lucorum TaxID=248454 RepID=A0A6A4JZF9_APOLU|nr:hypothetical protein GE061_005565 [Apolygus lucorum]
MSKEARGRWRCDTCRDGGGSDSDANSIDSQKKKRSDEVYGNPSKAEQAILEVNQKLNTLLAAVEDIKELKNSVNFMSDQFDVFSEKVMTLESTIADLSKENTELKSVVTELQYKVDILEQNSRKTNIELNCVPETKNENCIEIVKAASNVLSVDCGEIQTAFRVGVQRRDRPRKILALFESSEAADALIKAAKTDKNITANQLYKGWPNDRVYINENLTSYRADLLRRAKVKAKENGYKYVWLKNFIVHVRKDDGERVLTIKTIADLERM